MSADVELFVRVLCYAAISVSMLAYVLGTWLLGSALVEHTREHHARLWRDVGGPVVWPFRSDRQRLPAPWVRVVLTPRVALAWTIRTPHSAGECAEFRCLQRRMRVLVGATALMIALSATSAVLLA